MINHMINMAKYGLEYFGLYYGTYRGQVKDNQDPQNMGRVKVHCPTVHGDQFPDCWAMPISPYAGDRFGLWAVPDVGEWVYVRFDHGRLDYPLWEGGWWGQSDATSDFTPKNVVLATKEGLKLVISRDSKQILIQQDNGNSVLISGLSIALNHQGDIAITAQGAVSIQSQKPISIVAPEVDVTGNLSVTGELAITNPTTGQPGSVQGNIAIAGTVSSTGDGTFNGHSVSNHVHDYNGSPTTPPVG